MLLFLFFSFSKKLNENNLLDLGLQEVFTMSSQEAMFSMDSHFVSPGKKVFADSAGDEMPYSRGTELFLVRVTDLDDAWSLAHLFSKSIGPVNFISIIRMACGSKCAVVRFHWWRDNLFTRMLWSELVIISELNKFLAPCQRTCCSIKSDVPGDPFYKLLLSYGVPRNGVVIETSWFFD